MQFRESMVALLVAGSFFQSGVASAAAGDDALAERLELLEIDVEQLRAANAEAGNPFEGVELEASLTTIGQRASGVPAHAEGDESQLNYRADLGLGLPLDGIGDIEQKFYLQVRIGQGDGLNPLFSNLGVMAGTPNAVAFRASGANPDDSVLVIGQALYQANIPLPLGGFLPHSRKSLEFTVGKMDLYGFFDQNEVANDEAAQFLNSVFVNNPFLDAGGEAATDANGFQPGMVLSFLDEANAAEPYRLTAGVFGAGSEGSNFQRSFHSPLFLVQLEKQWKIARGMSGNYRLYGWTRDDAENLDGSIERHSGAGISFDQRLGQGIQIFGRYGELTKGYLAFDKAVTLGGEINGAAWGRAGDNFGLAAAWLNSDKQYRQDGGSIDLDADGVADLAFLPSGAEQVAEIYYRYRLSPQVELTPDLQWIGRPGGNSGGDDVKVISLRATFSY